MDDVNLLLRRIIETPEDDTLRGAYADALDERGGPNDSFDAEFIRTQIEYHRLANMDPKNLYIEDWDNLRALRNRNKELWADKIHHPLLYLPDGTKYFCSFDRKTTKENYWLQVWKRGFCEEIRYDHVHLLELLPHLIWNVKGTDECPPTAQPIHTVHFMDLPDKQYSIGSTFISVPYISVCRIDEEWHGRGEGEAVAPSEFRRKFRDVIEDRWPGIKFVFPVDEREDQIPELVDFNGNDIG